MGPGAALSGENALLCSRYCSEGFFAPALTAAAPYACRPEQAAMAARTPTGASLQQATSQVWGSQHMRTGPKGCRNRFHSACSKVKATEQAAHLHEDLPRPVQEAQRWPVLVQVLSWLSVQQAIAQVRNGHLQQSLWHWHIAPHTVLSHQIGAPPTHLNQGVNAAGRCAAVSQWLRQVMRSWPLPLSESASQAVQHAGGCIAVNAARRGVLRSRQ